MLVAAPHMLRITLSPTEGIIASIKNDPVNALRGQAKEIIVYMSESLNCCKRQMLPVLRMREALRKQGWKKLEQR